MIREAMEMVIVHFIWNRKSIVDENMVLLQNRVKQKKANLSSHSEPEPFREEPRRYSIDFHSVNFTFERLLS